MSQSFPTPPPLEPETPGPSAAGPAGPRPTVVTAAAGLLIFVAVALVVLALLPLPYAGKVADVTKVAYANVTNGAQIANVARIGAFVALALYLIVAIGLAVLARFDLRGSYAARIVTWVVGGLGVLCCGGSAGLGGVASSMGTRNANGVDTTALKAQIKAIYPAWYQPTTVTLTVLLVLALIVALILLALPAANAYFRRAPNVVS